MTDSEDRRVFRLPRENIEFLELERRRLKEEHGLNVSIPEIISCLVELHKMRMIQLATRDKESVAWFHRTLAENGKV